MSTKRFTDLLYAMFPVEEKPVFLFKSKIEGENLFSEKVTKKTYEKIPKFKAIVDIERDYTFSVVAENYRLVTNQEAVELGEKCFQTLFSKTTSKSMAVFNITMPKTRSFCHIDFFNEDVGFEPWVNDRWVPFLRVTNSYNRTKLLRFDLGFCRWICTNGMIFGKKSISFQYMHTRGEVARTVEFHTSFSELKNLEKKFIENIHNLKRYYIPKEVMFPLLCKVLEIKVNKEDFERPKRLEKLLEFRSHAYSLTDKYFNEMGPNGYAALNVITDFASRPKLYISSEAMVDGLQKRSGDWITDFIQVIQNPKFNFEDYVGDNAKQLTNYM